MNCCNANGECTQGRDCPIRKQRAQEANDAYIENSEHGSFVELLAWITLVALISGLGILAIATWRIL